LTLCRIGNNVELQTANIKLYRESPFFGQMGPYIYFFEDALSPQQIQGIHSLGTEYLGTFQPERQDLHQKRREERRQLEMTHRFNLLFFFKKKKKTSSLTGKFASILDGSLTKLIFINFNAKVLDGKVAIDNTPERPKDKLLSAKMFSVNICVARDVKDVIHCLGGMKVRFSAKKKKKRGEKKLTSTHTHTQQVFLPLFWLLDQPFASGNPDAPLDYNVDSFLAVQAQSLIRDMLAGSPTNQEEMWKEDSFALISYLLRKVSPKHKGLEVLGVMKDMISKLVIPGKKREKSNDLSFSSSSPSPFPFLFSF
jgi:hypothetical protein